MKLYNTLTRKTEELRPLNPPTVTVYTCGPTVYDYPQIGNWFTYVRWDTLIRVLRASNFQPKWVLNFTDVGHLVSDADEGEDKLEKGARRENKTAWEVAEYYTQDFINGMHALNMLEPYKTPKATEHINEQIELIKKLEEKGFTYKINDGIYYDTSKFPKYSDFAKLDLEEQQAGARVEVNPEKHNPTDFALWKFSPKDKKRDMEWESPWGVGFPGWHIECSAMSMKYLGETLDIHTGGIDHIQIHHTNEIAQSEPITGKPFANIWLHGNHITVNGEKISKSLGNSIRLQEIEAKGFSALVVRMHVLESHYRSQSKFSWESLEAAKNRLNGYRELAALIWQSSEDAQESNFMDASTEILAALQDDLNTPAALARLNAFSDRVKEQGISPSQVDSLKSFLRFIDAVLGLELSKIEDISGAQKELIAQREQARTKKDWEKSDEIRTQLEVQKIAIRDIQNGTIWRWL
jgi:cysteinyl-tRNA synthetase